jgi:DNA-binding transcriptional regulator YiaG
VPVHDTAVIEPAQIAALRERLRLNKTQFAVVLETDRGHLSKLEDGDLAVAPGPLGVLLRWLFSAYVIEGGAPPHPSIPLTRARVSGETHWNDEPDLDGCHIGELRDRMGLSKKAFAAVVGMTYGHVYKLEKVPGALKRGSTRVLLRWLYAVFGLPAGRPPHPSIPVVRAG